TSPFLKFLLGMVIIGTSAWCLIDNNTKRQITRPLEDIVATFERAGNYITTNINQDIKKYVTIDEKRSVPPIDYNNITGYESGAVTDNSKYIPKNIEVTPPSSCVNQRLANYYRNRSKIDQPQTLVVVPPSASVSVVRRESKSSYEQIKSSTNGVKSLLENRISDSSKYNPKKPLTEFVRTKAYLVPDYQKPNPVLTEYASPTPKFTGENNIQLYQVITVCNNGVCKEEIIKPKMVCENGGCIYYGGATVNVR
ncbi:MAG: hypothetical protein V2A62_04220, partial [Candidatus Woesearchaeota archaeon]